MRVTGSVRGGGRGGLNGCSVEIIISQLRESLMFRGFKGPAEEKSEVQKRRRSTQKLVQVEEDSKYEALAPLPEEENASFFCVLHSVHHP